MPDLESLNETSDYSGFMSTNVSEALQKMALRQLFTSETYHIRDGLDEYDGDYTHFEKLDPSTITADMKHMLKVAERRLKEEEDKQEAQERLRQVEQEQEQEQIMENEE